MLAFLVMALLFSSILYSATKYTYTKLNRTPQISSLLILCSTIAVLYIPREFSECVYNPIEDHVEVSFMLIMSELARVVYGVSTDTLAPAITSSHIAANFITRLGDPCSNAQFSTAVVIIGGCLFVETTRNSHHRNERTNKKRQPIPLVTMTRQDAPSAADRLDVDLNPTHQESTLLRF
jgi:hypothetical protein